jgi:hypothetical protein
LKTQAFAQRTTKLLQLTAHSRQTVARILRRIDYRRIDYQCTAGAVFLEACVRVDNIPQPINVNAREQWLKLTAIGTNPPPIASFAANSLL